MVAALAVLAAGFAVFCRLHVDQAYDGSVVRIQDMQAIPKADYIVVPAAKIDDGTVSAHMQDRIDSAIRLYKAGRAKTILISGGYSQNAKGYEAEIVRAYAIEKGVTEGDLMVDNGGFDTYDTMCRAKEYFGDKTALICTQDQYAARTLYLARGVGISCTLVGSDIQDYRPDIIQTVREFFAASKAFLDIQLGPGPARTVAQLPYQTE